MIRIPIQPRRVVGDPGYHSEPPLRPQEVDAEIHVMLDIETLANRPGAAIVELAAQAFAFVPALGEIRQVGFQGFERAILPHEALWADIDTLRWHEKKGQWKGPNGIYMAQAFEEFGLWARDLQAELCDVATWWSWGATFDFPVLDYAWLVSGIRNGRPWKYWEIECARTVWRRAFGPDVRRPERSHRAADDVAAAIGDLGKALAALHRPTPPAP